MRQPPYDLDRPDLLAGRSGLAAAHELEGRGAPARRLGFPDHAAAAPAEEAAEAVAGIRLDAGVQGGLSQAPRSNGSNRTNHRGEKHQYLLSPDVPSPRAAEHAAPPRAPLRHGPGR